MKSTMICIPAPSSPLATYRARITPSSVDFAAREEVISRLEADYDQSLAQIDELNAKLEACLTVLTGKQAAASEAVAGAPVTERKAA